ncbi:hypothetical protein LMH87_004375 [Akanthomyces muscarius]|uniref:Uncharacterized protein n=1 Tax=Akanthomyces muscarius TaxID=2231603 RepID=A0A9W8UFJ8_AKAMU|nr:hypothetical protein LMH87_004375 [Akanthomyces muscarius]KAJ4145527.1 hypothetical protein LMH87_004375 [Akanthomyces muscarius]
MASDQSCKRTPEALSNHVVAPLQSPTATCRPARYQLVHQRLMEKLSTAKFATSLIAWVSSPCSIKRPFLRLSFAPPPSGEQPITSLLFIRAAHRVVDGFAKALMSIAQEIIATSIPPHSHGLC